MNDFREKTEKIGGVTLDYTLYSGRDLYCDGAVEEELLEIAQTTPAERFDEVIRDRLDWPTLYHLSSIRGNIVDWLPLTGQEKVLEIGSGPGAITGTLAKKAKEVTCVELSQVRSLINAYRNRDADNICIRVGNFEDIEPVLPTDYDYVFLIGVLEYAESYLHTGQDPFVRELSIIRRHLKPGGRIVVAIENRLGMKYFAGSREDHSARYYDGIENYPREKNVARTFSKPALEKILQESGSAQYSFYYPYPDYKFMSALYSDKRLPSESELNENLRNFDQDRLLVFDEKKAFGGVIADGLFPQFSNSFLVVTGAPLPVVYCKYSNDRAPQYRIRTMQTCGENGDIVTKTPMSDAAAAHIRRLLDSCRRLTERYAGSGLKIAPCTSDGDAAVFPMIPGVPLERMLDERLMRDDIDAFFALLEEYRSRVGCREETAFADQDMIFSNILVDGESWTAIDYEWAAEEAHSAQEMLLRSLHVYFLEDEKRRRRLLSHMTMNELYARLGADVDEAMHSIAREKAFQDGITKGQLSLGDLRAVLGKKVIVPAEIAAEEEGAASGQAVQAKNLATVQVYFDTGKGYSEEESFFVDEPYQGEGMITFHVDLPAEARRLRIDPALCPCVVLLHSMRLNGQTLAAGDKLMKTNGRREKDGSLFFTTFDPSMEWDAEKLRRKAGARGDKLRVSFTIQMAGIPATMAASLSEREKR